MAFRDRCVVVTGASRGLGAGLARSFAARGMRLALCSRQAPALVDHAEVLSRRADVRDADAVQRFAEQAEERFGALDLWINNAGILEPIEPLRSLQPRDFQHNLEVNLMGVVHGTQAFLAHLRRRGGEGVLVNISSGAARRPSAGWSAYCAAKAAVERLTECVALEEREAGLRAYAVAPGVIDTDMQAMIRATPEARFPERPRFEARKQDGRFSSPEFIAGQLLRIAFEERPDEVLLRLPEEPR